LHLSDHNIYAFQINDLPGTLFISFPNNISTFHTRFWVRFGILWLKSCFEYQPSFSGGPDLLQLVIISFAG